MNEHIFWRRKSTKLPLKDWKFNHNVEMKVPILPQVQPTTNVQIDKPVIQLPILVLQQISKYTEKHNLLQIHTLERE